MWEIGKEIQQFLQAYTVGWSDLVLFSIFENLHFSADQVYF